MLDGLRRNPPRLAALTAALACLVGAAYLGSSWRDENRLEDAKAAARAGDYAGTVRIASAVTGAPSRVRALVVTGYAQLELGDAEAAVSAFQRATEDAPNDAAIRRALATALQRAGRPVQARRQLARASALDPRGLLPPGFGG